MTSADRLYLQGVLNAYVEVSIQRIAHSGVLNYHYRLSGAELRAATGRQRLHEPVINDVISFFANANADAKYDTRMDNFDIAIDLNSCILDRGQAEFLSVAMTTFRESL